MRKWLATCAMLLAAGAMTAQTTQEIHEDYEARLGKDTASLAETLQKFNFGKEGREAMEFLYAYMPYPDMADYTPAYHAEQTACALRARREMPWGSIVPRREWLHFVLPVRVNNENLDVFRTEKYEELKRRVQGLSMQEAVLEVNHWCHEYVTYKPSDSRTSSPLASMRTATGRCGEESTFTVAALRAVGIPARQVYTPRWAHTDDNHAWVEAWVEGKWYFLGACEPEPVLNLGWFNQPASRGMLMHTKVFGRYDGPEDVISTTACNTEINVTSNYAPVSRMTIRVVDEQGNAVSDANIDFRLYNYAELYNVLRTKTDQNGRASITAGLGDLVAWAAKDGRYGYVKFTVGQGDETVLKLDKRTGDAFEADLNIVPPMGSSNLPHVTAEASALNERRKAHEDSIRTAYVATFPDSAQTALFCKKQQLDYSKVHPIIQKSCGNYANVYAFLTRKTAAEVQLAYDILATLSDKDLRDFDLSVLEDHHKAAKEAGQSITKDFGVRITNEFLTPWRSYFRQAFTASEQKKFMAQPEKLAEWIRKNVETDDKWNPQSYCLSPESAHKHRRSDSRSKGILFVAAARSIGIPARIDEVTGKVQYRPVPADASSKTLHPWKTVTLTEESGRRGHNNTPGTLSLNYQPRQYMENPSYYYHFTLSRLTDGRPVLQEYAEGDTWSSRFAKGVEVDAADYLLTSGTRMADGSVLAHLAVVPVRSGEGKSISLTMRKDNDKLQVIGSFNSENIYFDAGANASAAGNTSSAQPEGREKSILSTTGRGYFVAGLIRANHEPSNHILHDLEKLRTELEAWGRPILLLFSTHDEFDRFNKNRAEFTNLPSTLRFGVDSKGQVAKDLFGSGLTKTQEQPVIILGDTFNRVVFMTQGYTIGIGEQIKQALGKL